MPRVFADSEWWGCADVEEAYPQLKGECKCDAFSGIKEATLKDGRVAMVCRDMYDALLLEGLLEGVE